jgi:Zn-dependent peptidase ImmA (M78 family)
VAAEQERARLATGSVPIANVAELLETQGIRTAQLSLPRDVSGLMLAEPRIGIFVVTNAENSYVRRRFSAAHEYAHALLDRERLGIVSRDRDASLTETRANVFAAHFLMPAQGVQHQIEILGKGSDATKAQREIQLYDVVQLSHYFGVSRLAALFQLLNLKLISQVQFDDLRGQEEKAGKRLSRLLALPSPDDDLEKREFRHRFLGLAIEAFRRQNISLGKLHEIGRMAGAGEQEMDQVLESLGLDAADGDDGTLNPVFFEA